MKLFVFFYNINYYLVLDRSKGPLVHLLRPNTIRSPNTTFGKFTCNTPPSRKGGCTELARLVQTNDNVSLQIPAINSLAVTLPTIS